MREQKKQISSPPHQQRMCVVCRDRAEQQTFIRLSWNQGRLERFGIGAKNSLETRIAGRAKGRGCYVHANLACVAKLESKVVSRALRLEAGLIAETLTEIRHSLLQELQ